MKLFIFNRKRKPTKFSIALRRLLLVSIPHFYDLPAGARFPYSGSSNAIEFRIDDEGKMGKLFLLDFYSRRVEATSWVRRVPLCFFHHRLRFGGKTDGTWRRRLMPNGP